MVRGTHMPMSIICLVRIRLIVGDLTNCCTDFEVPLYWMEWVLMCRLWYKAPWFYDSTGTRSCHRSIALGGHWKIISQIWQIDWPGSMIKKMDQISPDQFQNLFIDISEPEECDSGDGAPGKLDKTATEYPNLLERYWAGIFGRQVMGSILIALSFLQSLLLRRSSKFFP